VILQIGGNNNAMKLQQLRLHPLEDIKAMMVISGKIRNQNSRNNLGL